MKLVKEQFTWSSWDDGEYNFDIQVSTTNDSDQTVELIKTSCVLMSDAGSSVGGSFRDEEDVYMEPGEAASFNVRAGYNVLGVAIGGDPSTVKAQIDVTALGREFFTLGELEVPTSEKEVATINDHKEVSGGTLKILGATLKRYPKDDDGDTRVEAQVGLRNTGEDAVQKAVVKMILMDREGSQIDYSEYDEIIPPRSSVFLEPSSYTKAGRLKGATVKLTVSLFQPIENMALSLDSATKED